MIRHHRFRFALAALALAAFGAAQADAQTPTKVKMRLDWKGGAQHAPFYFGKQKGYYKDEGLDLDIIPGSGSSDTIKQIGSKDVSFWPIEAGDQGQVLAVGRTYLFPPLSSGGALVVRP